MGPQTDKIALFIDGANLYATAKALGFDIDYKRLLREFQSRGYLLRAFYYTAVIEDQEYSSIRPLIDWLDYNGYTVVTKATKEFVDQTGRRKVKGNMDIELAVDAMEIAEHIDQMVLFSGDGDFRSLVEADAAPRRAGHRRLDDLDTAADGRRRTAAAGRRLPRYRRTAAQDRARSLRAGAARATRAASHPAIPAAQHLASAGRRWRRRRRIRGLNEHAKARGGDVLRGQRARVTIVRSARALPHFARTGAGASRTGSMRRSRASARSRRGC